jgi:ketosteroid isomerase-like protein
MDDPTAALAAITDQLAIERVIYDASAACDRMDWELLESCYLPDATVDFGDFVKGSVQDYFAFSKGESGLPSLERTMHTVSNVSIDVDGDVAHSESYVVAAHSGPEGHPWCAGFVVVHVRHLDRFERHDGRWSIAERTAVFEWARNEATGEALPIAVESLGVRSHDDLRYARLSPILITNQKGAGR